MLTATALPPRCCCLCCRYDRENTLQRNADMQERVPQLEDKLGELKDSATTLGEERPGYVDEDHAYPVLADKLEKAQEQLTQYKSDLDDAIAAADAQDALMQEYAGKANEYRDVLKGHSAAISEVSGDPEERITAYDAIGEKLELKLAARAMLILSCIGANELFP